MKFVGIDLHKETITACVVDQSRTVLERKRLICREELLIKSWFQSLGPFQAVVEATASFEWLLRKIDPVAERVVLAHPKKLRVIAESTRKSDRLDAQTLAEFLALGLIPTAYRPSPREHDHRRLVRHRAAIQRRITALKNRIRRMMDHYNADRPDLFRVAVLQALDTFPCSSADRFSLRQLREELWFQQRQLQESDRALREFAQNSPIREREQRELLQTIPGVGFVTAEVVLAELGDIRRFQSGKEVVSYAGLCPGQRESAGKSRELHIEKSGSKHLRWILVEAAWRLVRLSPRWHRVYAALKARMKSKKAIVAVARRLLTLMAAILRDGRPYSAASL
jgi:transposase